MARKHLFWVVPLLLLTLAILAGLLALPAFVAAPAHRATMESFASQLTGRKVHISGKLSLSYLPQPEITATGITITGPDQEIITARALSLNISLLSLLRGQFGVQTLRLDSPTISFPWPIPGGINDVAPPPWLAALHAQLNNGRIRVGALDFSDVKADLFTGTGGSVRMSGTGRLNQEPIALQFSIGQTASIGATSLSAHAKYAGITAAFDGALDGNSRLSGQLALQAPEDLTGHMQILLNATALDAFSLTLQQGPTSLTGNAQLSFKPTRLTANLVGTHLDLDHIPLPKSLWPGNTPIQAHLDISDIVLAGRHFPSLKTVFVANAKGYALQNLNLGIKGTANLKGNVLSTPNGTLSGTVDLSAPDGSALMAGLYLPYDKNWTSILLRAQLGGTRSAPQLTNISGTLGPDHVGGHIFFSPHHAAFQLNFSQLALQPLLEALRQSMPASGFTADGELTAIRAEAGPVKLSNLFIDASLGNGVNIRRVTADLYGGMAGGDVVLNQALDVTAAHGFLNLPVATPLLGALFPHLQLPHALLNQRLNMIAAAAGTPTALASATVIKLGDLTFTATPFINLDNASASGAVSLRAPDAIATLKAAGLIDGCSRMTPSPDYPFRAAAQPCIATPNNPGLAFPGPGSLSMRAAFSISPNQYGLTNFVLNSGWLNASGHLNLQHGLLTGQINAGTLALPALPLNAPIPDKLPISGQVDVSATQILYAGHRIFGPAIGTFTLAPDTISLSNLKAALGHGALTGRLDLKLLPNTIPALNANLTATDIDASALDLPQAFPLSLSHGQINANAVLSASGYSIKTWLATLGGNVTLTAQNGNLEGVSLPNIVHALRAGQLATTRYWMQHGDTAFTALSVSASISQGNCTLTKAVLTSKAGNLSAVGGVDLFDNSLALRLDAQPALQPKLTLTSKIIGSWVHPSKTVEIGAASAWRPTNVPPP